MTNLLYFWVMVDPCEQISGGANTHGSSWPQIVVPPLIFPPETSVRKDKNRPGLAAQLLPGPEGRETQRESSHLNGLASAHQREKAARPRPAPLWPALPAVWSVARPPFCPPLRTRCFAAWLLGPPRCFAWLCPFAFRGQQWRHESRATWRAIPRARSGSMGCSWTPLRRRTGRAADTGPRPARGTALGPVPACPAEIAGFRGCPRARRRPPLHAALYIYTFRIDTPCLLPCC